MNKLHILLSTIIMVLTSCNNIEIREVVYKLAKENKEELQLVLSHYKDEKQKLEAAKFLLSNMLHSSYQGAPLDAYRVAIFKSDSPLNYDSIWTDVTHRTHNEEASKVYDAEIISSDYVIRNIDEAFDVWEKSPWYSQIDFNVFCNYILPYRVLDEPLSDWRKVLNSKYACLIENVSNPKEAFEIIHKHILKEFRDRKHKCPYTPDVLLLDKMQQGICRYRSVYLVSVLRSLGIPAAYDMIHIWANYSQSGHSWAAYVENDSIDSFAMHNHIDGAVFNLKSRVNEVNCRLKFDTIKKASKVYRRNYRVQTDYNKAYTNPELVHFNDYFAEDVSQLYGLSGVVKLKKKKDQEIFLCTFVPSQSWKPAIKGIEKGETTIFENIGCEIAYLPAYVSHRGVLPTENPFILCKDGTQKNLNPDTTHVRSVVLKRKYVLFALWINRWSKVIGAGIDVSNDPDFKKFDRLYSFKEIPEGITKVDILTSSPFRYIRFYSPAEDRPNIAEIKFYGVNKENKMQLLQGSLIANGIDKKSAMKAFDNDYFTYTITSNYPHWFGLDLGEKNEYRIKQMEYCLHHDMNMIEIGDHYELFYYDYGWHSLGKQIAASDSLIYDNVPSHSLLWLRNHTKGREERIFTYQDGEQIWW